MNIGQKKKNHSYRGKKISASDPNDEPWREIRQDQEDMSNNTNDTISRDTYESKYMKVYTLSLGLRGQPCDIHTAH